MNATVVDKKIIRRPPPEDLPDLFLDVPDEVQWRFRSDGDKSRLDYDLAHAQILRSGTHIDTFDGKVSKSFFPKASASGGVEYGAGFIRADGFARSDRLFKIAPLRWAFLGVNYGGYRLDQKSFTVSKERRIINIANCVILQCVDPNGLSHSFWCDPQKDYAILRYALNRGDILIQQLDCSVEKHPSGMWLPQKWTVVWFESDGRIAEMGEMQMLTCIVNPKFDDPDLFDFTFPVGTVINDARQDLKAVPSLP